MACINPDGTLAPAAKTILKALETPATPAEVAQRTGLPLFRVRSSLRELTEAGLLESRDEVYYLTATGKEKAGE